MIPDTYENFRLWLVNYVKSVWTLPDEFAKGKTEDINLEELGIDSLEAHMLATLIEDDYGVEFDPSLLLEYPTLNKLAKRCTDDYESKKS
jgi:acyl carrier protein